jgi:four helix bundle protein
MEYVKSFCELEVYKVSRQLSTQIFGISKNFPGEEMYSLTDQITRSSRSIGTQIAEAWGKRKYEKYFVSKLTDSDAEQLETQQWVETALSCSCIQIIRPRTCYTMRSNWKNTEFNDSKSRIILHHPKKPGTNYRLWILTTAY